MKGGGVIKLGRLCRDLAGQARGSAREMAAAATEAFRDRLADSEHRLRSARLRRDAAVGRLQTFADRVAAFCIAVYQVTGHQRPERWPRAELPLIPETSQARAAGT